MRCGYSCRGSGETASCSRTWRRSSKPQAVRPRSRRWQTGSLDDRDCIQHLPVDERYSGLVLAERSVARALDAWRAAVPGLELLRVAQHIDDGSGCRRGRSMSTCSPERWLSEGTWARPFMTTRSSCAIARRLRSRSATANATERVAPVARCICRRRNVDVG